ncbi:MAG: DUF1574 domain-containing protein [Cyanobacteria bacterium P01_D01_bin.156]
MLSYVSSEQQSTLDPTTLLPWLEEVVNHDACSLKLKLRGNILHAHAKTAEGLEREYVLLRLVRSLLEPERKATLLKDFPQIYQLYFYSVRPNQSKPDWSSPIYLNRLERHLEQLVETSADLDEVKRSTAHLTSAIGYLDDATSAIVLSNASLARKGDPDAIARYLSQTLSALDVGVDVVVNAIPGKAKRAQGVVMATTVDPSRELINRLWILCRAAYSPDPAMVANPTAQRLRELKLTQFQDAVISVQVLGEDIPDWRLRVDLTPDEEILREWSRWGDPESIDRLLNQALHPLDVSVQTEVKNDTLHLVCQPLAAGKTVSSGSGDDAEPETAPETDIIDALEPLLEQLAPQGLSRAMVYGPSLDGINPVWLRCLELPASEHADLATSTDKLARQGDLPAIAYCMTKRLNPDLDEQLSTGGIRVQLLMRDQRLHVMIDAPVCPPRRQVVPQLQQYLQQQPIEGLSGVRIYGRQSGQKRPDWHYGYDRHPKKRLVPEATPEFAASEAYLEDLVQPAEAEDSWNRPTLERIREQVQQLLIKTQLFTSANTNPEESLTAGRLPNRTGIALAWGALGLLLTFQADWIMGQLFKTRFLALSAPTPAPISLPPVQQRPSTFEEELAKLNWGQKDGDETVLIEEEISGAGFASSAISDSDLLASPPQQTVSMTEVLAASPFPSFKSKQLTEKLALYDWYVAENGPPDVLVFGSSRALRGVDPTALKQALIPLGYEDVSVFNFGVNGATAQIADLVVRQLLATYPSPKMILWTDGARAFNSSRVDVTFNAIATSEGYQQLIAGELFDNDRQDSGAGLNPAQRFNRYYAQLDERLSESLGNISSAQDERSRLEKATQTKAVNNPAGGAINPTETDLIDAEGFLPLAVQFNPATYYLDHPRVAGAYDGDYKAFEMQGSQENALRQMLTYTQSHGIDVVFVNTPLTDEYLDPARLEVESYFQRYMLQLAAQEPGLLYRDLVKLWPNRYGYFSDPSHLNRFGAYQLSLRLAQDPMIPWQNLRSEKID